MYLRFTVSVDGGVEAKVSERLNEKIRMTDFFRRDMDS